MIPTNTGAAAAVGLVMPDLNGKLDVTGTTHMFDNLRVDGDTYLSGAANVEQDINGKSNLKEEPFWRLHVTSNRPSNFKRIDVLRLITRELPFGPNNNDSKMKLSNNGSHELVSETRPFETKCCQL